MTFRSRLTDDQFATFVELSTPQRYRRHERIPDAVGLITDGVVRLGTALCGAGDLVGLEECFLSGDQESSNRTAFAHDRVEILQMPFETFRRFATETAPLAVMQEQAARTKKALLDQARAAMPVQDRIGTYLMDLAIRFGYEIQSYGVVLGLDLTQDQMAQAIGVSRAAVEKGLRRLRDDGYVQTHYRSLVLTEKFMAEPRGTWSHQTPKSRVQL